jgi:hypothetical protein
MRSSALTRALAICTLLGACSNSSGPTTGVLIVGNTTFGSNLPTGTYTVTVDGTGDGTIALDVGGDWSLAAGTHSIGLTGLPGNCATVTNNAASTGPNPQDAGVVAGDTVEVWFAVSCQ